MMPPDNIPGNASYSVLASHSATTSSPSGKLRTCRPLSFAGPQPKQARFGANVSWILFSVMFNKPENTIHELHQLHESHETFRVFCVIRQFRGSFYFRIIIATPLISTLHPEKPFEDPSTLNRHSSFVCVLYRRCCEASFWPEGI